jgi:hypothetical protein
MPVTRIRHRKWGKTRIEGDMSTVVRQWFYGHIICGLDSYFALFMVLLSIQDSYSWIVLTIIIVLFILGFGIFLDYAIAYGLEKAWEIWWPDHKPHTQVYLPSWVALRTMFIGLLYYILVYDAEGSYKPAWLDWLG